MNFKMIHENYNVSDLDKSIKFYNEALDLHEVRRKTTDDFIIVYLSNDVSDFELELTWLKEHPQPYDLGECEFHLAFRADDYEAAYKKHKEMGCILMLRSFRLIQDKKVTMLMGFYIFLKMQIAMPFFQCIIGVMPV